MPQDNFRFTVVLQSGIEKNGERAALAQMFLKAGAESKLPESLEGFSICSGCSVTLYEGVQ
jgi:hypothetical protein